MCNTLQNLPLAKSVQSLGNPDSMRRITPVQLKPLAELLVNQPSGININDSLVRKIDTVKPNLMSPLELFKGENASSQTANPDSVNNVNSSPKISSVSEYFGLSQPGVKPPIRHESKLKKFINGLPKLMNPFELFKNNSSDLKAGLKNIKIKSDVGIEHSISNMGQGSKENISIIEPGSSIESIKAIKQIPGRQWLGRLASNGNREAAVIIPEGVDYNKPFEIIYHFHGHDGSISKSLTDANYGLKDQIKNMAKDRNIIVVVPQGPPKALDYTWMNGKNNEDMQQFENDIMNIVGTKLDPGVQISSITVKGHSAGGRPIMNSALEGKLAVDRVDFLDSSYGTWASLAYNNIIKMNPDAKFNVIYIPGSQTQADALSLQGKKGVSMIKSTVDHSSVPKTYFAI